MGKVKCSGCEDRWLVGSLSVSVRVYCVSRVLGRVAAFVCVYNTCMCFACVYERCGRICFLHCLLWFLFCLFSSNFATFSVWFFYRVPPPRPRACLFYPLMVMLSSRRILAISTRCQSVSSSPPHTGSSLFFCSGIMYVVSRLACFLSQIVFSSKKRNCDKLAQAAWDRGFAVDSLHGDREQWERTKVMDQYRSGEVRLLVATDVAARGLDVKDISYVINYDFPVDGVEVRCLRSCFSCKHSTCQVIRGQPLSPLYNIARWR